MSAQDEPVPILNRYRVTIPMRLRFFAEVANAMHVARKAKGTVSRMRARRLFRLGMEKQRIRKMRTWPERNLR